jgi:hypothetical protein
MPHLFGKLEQQRRTRSKPFAQGGFTNKNFGNFVHVKPYATGGLTDPIIGLPNSTEFQRQTIAVTASAEFTDAQVAQIGRIIAIENGRVVRTAIGEGLGDANRRLERERSLEEQRTI